MRFSNLDDWLRWQETLHPQKIDLSLERVAAVWQQLSADLGHAKVITVAGTNGKGSCVAMLESILLAAGYHVGAYTSPHLLHYNERIRINGQMVSDETLCQAFARVDQARGETTLSYFEFGTLAALLLFAGLAPAAQALDVVLLEVGLGGRLDAVNIIDADIALILSIAIDHSEWLGTDRDSIAIEKAGIFRHGRAAVCGDPDPPAALLDQACLQDVPLYCLGREYHQVSQPGSVSRAPATWTWYDGQRRLDGLPKPHLEGDIQLDNAASVLQVLLLLEHELPLTDAAISAGLSRVRLPGRYQRLYCRPPALQLCRADDDQAVAIIADVAHNPAAAVALAQSLKEDKVSGATRAVFGMLKDKDMAAVVAALDNEIDYWYVTEPAAERACPATVLYAELQQVDVNGRQGRIRLCDGVDAAVQQALLDASAADGNDRLLVFGSFYTVAEFLAAVASVSDRSAGQELADVGGGSSPGR